MPRKVNVSMSAPSFTVYKVLSLLLTWVGMTSKHSASSNTSIMKEYRTETLTGLFQASLLLLWGLLKKESKGRDQGSLLINILTSLSNRTLRRSSGLTKQNMIGKDLYPKESLIVICSSLMVLTQVMK